MFASVCLLAALCLITILSAELAFVYDRANEMASGGDDDDTSSTGRTDTLPSQCFAFHTYWASDGDSPASTSSTCGVRLSSSDELQMKLARNPASSDSAEDIYYNDYLSCFSSGVYVHHGQQSMPENIPGATIDLPRIFNRSQTFVLTTSRGGADSWKASSFSRAFLSAERADQLRIERSDPLGLSDSPYPAPNQVVDYQVVEYAHSEVVHTERAIVANRSLTWLDLPASFRQCCTWLTFTSSVNFDASSVANFMVRGELDWTTRRARFAVAEPFSDPAARVDLSIDLVHFLDGTRVLSTTVTLPPSQSNADLVIAMPDPFRPAWTVASPVTATVAAPNPDDEPGPGLFRVTTETSDGPPTNEVTLTRDFYRTGETILVLQLIQWPETPVIFVPPTPLPTAATAAAQAPTLPPILGPTSVQQPSSLSATTPITAAAININDTAESTILYAIIVVLVLLGCAFAIVGGILFTRSRRLARDQPTTNVTTAPSSPRSAAAVVSAGGGGADRERRRSVSGPSSAGSSGNRKRTRSRSHSRSVAKATDHQHSDHFSAVNTCAGGVYSSVAPSHHQHHHHHQKRKSLSASQLPAPPTDTGYISTDTALSPALHHQYGPIGGARSALNYDSVPVGVGDVEPDSAPLTPYQALDRSEFDRYK